MPNKRPQRLLIFGSPPSPDLIWNPLFINYAYDFLAIILKFYWQTFEKNQGSSYPRELSRDLFSTGGKQKIAIFKLSRASQRLFNSLSWNPHGSKLSSSSCCRHQKFTYKCSSKSGNEAQSPDFGHFFLQFFAVLKLSVLAQAFGLEQWFFTKI